MRRWSAVLLVTAGVLVSACLTFAGGARAAGVQFGPVDSLPTAVREAPADVQEAYRFAVANPELLKVIPCYCGCEVFQHRDNYACYVDDVKPDGTVIYSDHGLG
jgi:hypothetical protein